MAFPRFVLFIYFIYLKFGLEPHQECTDNAEEVHGREPTDATELASVKRSSRRFYQRLQKLVGCDQK